MKSYSSIDSKKKPLDYKLLPYLLKYSKGFYVEAGANDGITQSNTMLLEKEFGWKGLLIEPSIKAYNLCKQNRSSENIIINCALVSTDDINTVKGDFDGVLMASINGERLSRTNVNIEVPAYTLSQIVKENNIKEIDFMSLDVEGYEIEVLKGIDLSSNWAPKIFLIEVYTHEFEELRKLLEPYYNFECNFSNYNKIDNHGWDGTHNDYLFIKKINLKN
jgi:FkbM family methyltransferase